MPEDQLGFAIIVDVSRTLETQASISTVFLDRDGVINKKMPEGEYVRSWQQFAILPGVAEAIGKLNHAGIRVIVVSNQRGIALGHYSAADVEMVHERLQKLLSENGAHVDSFYFCPHDRGKCNCRKPLIGLFDQARVDCPAIDPATSVMIGDSLSDVEFGHRAGMYTVFIIGPPETRRAGADVAEGLADAACNSLPEAVDLVLRRGERS